jgi:hypothetical protein
LNPEDIGKSRSAVIAKGAEDEILAFLVEDQYAGEHIDREGRWKMGWSFVVLSTAMMNVGGGGSWDRRRTEHAVTPTSAK